MYRQGATAEAAESMHKDALISALKKELYDLQDKEHEYLSLTDDVHNCESRFAILKEDKERIESEHRFFLCYSESKLISIAKTSQISGLKSIPSKCKYINAQFKSKTTLESVRVSREPVIIEKVRLPH